MSLKIPGVGMTDGVVEVLLASVLFSSPNLLLLVPSVFPARAVFVFYNLGMMYVLLAVIAHLKYGGATR
jgi:hypothetical protein